MRAGDASAQRKHDLQDLTGLISIVGKFKRYRSGETPSELQFAEALEREGRPVLRIDRSHLDELGRLVPYKSTVILINPSTFGSIKVLHNRGCYVIFQTLDVPDCFSRGPGFRATAKACDAVFATGHWEGFEGAGPKPFLYLPAAALSNVYPLNPKPTRSVLFLGSLYNGQRIEIARLVHSLEGKVIQRPNDRLYEKELALEVQQTKVVIGDNWTNETTGYWSSRNYIIPGCGGFLLTAYVPGIVCQFGPDGENVAYWNSLKALPKVLEFWLNNDCAREKVRRQGYEFVNRIHTWRARARVAIAHLEAVGR